MNSTHSMQSIKGLIFDETRNTEKKNTFRNSVRQAHLCIFRCFSFLSQQRKNQHK